MAANASKLPDTLEHLKCMGSPDRRHIFVTRSDQPLRTTYDPNYRVHKTTLGACEDRLVEASDQGAGVYLQLNRDETMKGVKRKAIHVKTATALFLDFDNGVPREYTHEPTVRTVTPRGGQFWYRIEPTEDISTWRAVQKALALANSADRQCVSPNQLGRLAGWPHQKKDPFLVRIEDSDSTRVYRLDEFFHLLPTEQEIVMAVEPDLSDVIGRRMDFPLLQAVLRRSVAKARNARVGEVWPTLRDQAYSLGHYVRFGLPWALAYNALMNVVAGWDDQARWHRVIVDGLTDGLRDSAFDPPFVPEAQQRTWAMADQRNEILDQLRAQALPVLVEVEDLLATFAWEDAWDGQRGAAVRAVNGLLAERGYVCKQRRDRAKGRIVRYWHKVAV